MSASVTPPVIPPRADATDSAAGAELEGRSDCLRVALTDACNPCCIHCHEETVGLSPRHFLLTDEQIVRLVRLFVELGFREVRFTGEPTLRSSLVELVRETAQLPGVQLVSMATNGTQLETFARSLKLAGLGRVDLVINPYHSTAFGGRPTRCGGLGDVRRAVNAAARAGLSLKIFGGACRELCERGELLELARLTLRHEWDVRYVEQPLPAPARRPAPLQSVPREKMLAQLAACFGSLEWQPGSDPAAGVGIFKLPGARGTLGFTRPAEVPIESRCDFFRLTAEGGLHFCRQRRAEVQLRMLLHRGANDDTLKAAIRQGLSLAFLNVPTAGDGAAIAGAST